MRRPGPLLALVALVGFGAASAGCEGYAETVSCGMGTVLDENDECVPPPVPDGGVEITSCAELCEAVAEWDAEQVGCLSGMLGMFGPPPAECSGDLTDVPTCTACVAAAGATDDLCATAGATCQ